MFHTICTICPAANVGNLISPNTRVGMNFLPCLLFMNAQFLDVYRKQLELVHDAFTQMATLARTHAPRGDERLHFLDTL